MSKQPTIRDVAKEAGVCTSTASRSLAGKGPEFRISPATVEKVQEAARRINYRGSAIARSLRTQRSGLIGIVVPDIANPVFAAIAGSITRAVEQRGYGVLMADSRDSTEREASHVAELAARQVEGLVVCPVGVTPDHLIHTSQNGVPVVTVDRVFSGIPLATVRSDQSNGAELSMQTLLDAGHQTIGCLQGIPDTLPNRERLSGYKAALASAGIGFDETLVLGEAFTIPSGVVACDELLRRRPDITALFTLSNQIAVGALETLKRLGLTVPRDLSIVAFDDHPLAPYLTPPLTACDQDEHQMGLEAADLLLEQIRTGGPPALLDRVVPVKFRSRESVGKPRSGQLDPSSWPSPIESQLASSAVAEATA